MTIDISRLGREPLSFEFTVSEKELDPDPGVSYAADAIVKGVVEQHAGDIRVVGEIRATPAIDCTRCLEPVEIALEVPFDVSFVRPEDFSSEKETELKGEDLKVDVLGGNDIDLSAIAREQLLLEMPAQIFCGEECKGLCDRCGVNLNRETCSCGDDDIDPRWAALKSFK